MRGRDTGITLAVGLTRTAKPAPSFLFLANMNFNYHEKGKLGKVS